ncbi:MAG: hypothetical protein AW08_01651 [Candidatus Accumulibacter adjunctus]|uniref:Uncharacterized protein n=1 Tax=Candidatus Accumulibacter adjunctus TaxID=1454001 RepID=A0A011NT50_9PROT|nr:MAG: hypothetical protein AW08_01651 [Candidatus Accumulibacter adjunctus]
MKPPPHSDHHPHAFREIPLLSGTVLGLWADPFIELATSGDWRVACAFSRPIAVTDFLVIVSWTGATWSDTSVRLGRETSLQLSSDDQQMFQEWLADEQTIAWFAELQQVAESAVTALQATAVTALTLAIQNPATVYVDNDVPA